MEQAVITVPAVLAFVAGTSVAMFVLFFIINKYIFYVFLGLFSYGSAISAAVCVHALVAEFRPAWLRPTVKLRPTWRVPLADVAAGLVGISVVVVWLALRCALVSHAWSLRLLPLSPSTQLSPCPFAAYVSAV